MTIEDAPICRVCIRQHKITVADYSLDDGEVQRWTLCKRHYDLIKYGLPLRQVQVTKLPRGEVS